ncbi:cytochrome P450 [Vararia minispora EC-137]|uniref:Cytochrome P450 n=1 Tax=Vararia minispora EC-137 TaxID=1314806 RepID=A0ACB8QSF6_9AGAM|nr:cytochrome P450 [Vararia minispora EC-137]
MHVLLSALVDHPVSLFISVTFLAFVLHVAYHLLLSPLSKVPGPWYAAVSDLWLTSHTLRLEKCKTIHGLLEKYGPIVRVGPNRVVFRDSLTAKTVYMNPTFYKSSYYKTLQMNDDDHAMTTLEHAEHAARRKGYASHYVPSNIATFQSEVQQYSVDLVDVLDNLAGKSSVDSLTLLRQYMVDVVTSVSFGCHVGALAKWAMDAEDEFCTAVGDFPKRGMLRGALPPWLWNLVCLIPIPRWQLLCRADTIMSKFVSERVYEARAQMTAGGHPDKKTLVHHLLEHKLSPAGASMSDREIIAEHMAHFVAGCDTTAITFTYMLWELSRREDITQNLQAELDAVMPDSKTVPDLSVLLNLPYLNAFIKEGLRMYSATPSLLERVVPTSMSRSSSSAEPFEAMGYILPPGTIVATQAWSVHRDASVFYSPETFAPERWLNAGPAALRTMEQHLMPFGLGTRVCGGMNFANIILRVGIASLLRNFDILVGSGTNERSMAILDSGFVVFPAAMKCNLTFRPRQQR